MVVQLDIVKVLAYCSYKRFMYVNVGDKVICIRITDSLYWYLRDLGVPTSQSLRYNKQK